MPPFEKEAWIGSRELTRKAKNLQRGGKKQKHRRTHGRKNCRQEKFRNHRHIKNTQRRKIARKQLTQTRNHEDICEYGRYANMMRIIIELLQARNNAARKANRGEVSKTFRLHSTVALQQPGVQLQRHEHCAGQAVA